MNRNFYVDRVELLDILMISLVAIGAIAVVWLFAYLFSSFIYVFSSTPTMGAIAYTPKWVFALSVLFLFRFSQRFEESWNKVAHSLNDFI